MGPLQSTISVLTLTAVAAGDIEASRFVTPANTQAVDGEAILGVSRYGEKTGNALAVDVIGVIDMVAGAAIAQGARVQSNADGLPITKAAGADAGLALTAAVNPGDIIKILVK
jgi:hypothetical protein